MAIAAAVGSSGTGEGGAWSESDRRAYYQKAIFPAILTGRVEDVVLAFEEGCPVDLIDERTGDNALLAAVRVGDVAITKVCLHAAVPFMPYGPKRENALQVAVKGGSLTCVEAILRMAMEAEDEDQCQYVLGLTDPEGNTPVHYAAMYGHSSILHYLLRYSNRELLLRNSDDRTPLHCVCAAAGSKASKKVRTIIVGGRGGPANVDFEACLEALMNAGSKKALNLADYKGMSPLHLAAESGALGVVQLLLGIGAYARLKNPLTEDTPRDLA